MRLIDADALVIPEYEETGDEFVDGFHEGKRDAILDVIVSAPTVDAVEVVRCKDCKYAGKHEAIFFPGHIICSLRMQPAPVKPDGFCSYGERRADDAID